MEITTVCCSTVLSRILWCRQATWHRKQHKLDRCSAILPRLTAYLLRFVFLNSTISVAGDNVNPERASSSTQFYIVWGQKFSDQQLEWAQSRIDKYTDGKAKLTPELCETYKTLGGTPHLDGSYTVFGEVLEGLEIVEKIQYAATDDNDRPINDIRIVTAKVVK